MLSSPSHRRLALLVITLAGCSSNSMMTSSSSSSSSSGGGHGGAASSSASSASSGGGHGGAATSSGSSGGGAGGAMTSTSSGGAGGAATSSGSSGGGTGGAMTSSSSSSSASSSSSGTGGGPTGTRVRIAAANLTSGNGQSWDPGHGIRILQGVHPDIILMQEMNYGTNSDPKLRELVDAVCGVTCDYARGAGMIPNGVVSRHPILESGSWVDPKVSNRDFTWARIDVPGPVDLWAVSVHLLTSGPTDRDAEAAALIANLQAVVPMDDYLVVGGDFNTDNRTEAVIGTFSSVLSTAAPYPADGNGNGNTSGPRTRPYDWLLASAGLRMREGAVVIGAAQFAAGLVVDTRVYTPLADIAPALQGDSGASGMQHMAVVRDFFLP